MSKTITEPAKQIDVIHETDVLVVGSGPGGLAAALAAARMGVKTTLVERFGCFGRNMQKPPRQLHFGNGYFRNCRLIKQTVLRVRG